MPPILLPLPVSCLDLGTVKCQHGHIGIQLLYITVVSPNRYIMHLVINRLVIFEFLKDKNEKKNVCDNLDFDKRRKPLSSENHNENLHYFQPYATDLAAHSAHLPNVKNRKCLLELLIFSLMPLSNNFGRESFTITQSIFFFFKKLYGTQRIHVFLGTSTHAEM